MDHSLLPLLQRLAPLRREDASPEGQGWNAALDALVESLHAKVPLPSALASLKVAPRTPASLPEEDKAAAAHGWMGALEAASALQ